MYPFEIEKFLKDRNYYIGGDDLTFITDIRQHPQLNHIKFNPYDSSYDMWDIEGHHYHFTAMPYSEAKAKGLIKERDDWERYE